jgi:hypothetical protein
MKNVSESREWSKVKERGRFSCSDEDVKRDYESRMQ